MDSIFIATPMFAGLCHGTYAASLLRVVPVFMNARVQLQWAHTVNESLVTRARDSLAHDFLETACTHLMFIDSDIGFQAEDILSMVNAGRDVICGVYPRKEIDWQSVKDAVADNVPAGLLSQYTGVPVVNTLPGGELYPAGPAVSRKRWPVEVLNAGTGFMLVRREVFERLSSVVPPYTSGKKFLRQFFTASIDPDSGVLLSEDFHFCRLARENGFTVWAAPWVKLTHTGSYTFGGDR